MIVFDHVSKVYPNGTVGLDDVDLTIADGEFAAIIGRSGAGKSTLLRSVNRMHRITSGTLTVNGTDVSSLSGKSLRRFRRGIGMVFQSFNLVTRTSVIQQQRVALARTLNQNPKIILADEPVASLDPITAKQVMQDFVHINKDMGITILLNIHHVELALEYADRIIGIRAGRIVYDGPSANVDKDILAAIYGEDETEEPA